MASEAEIITFKNKSPSEFFLSHRKGFIRSICELMRCRHRDVLIISAQESNSSSATKMLPKLANENRNVDILFTIRKQQINPTDQPYFSKYEIRRSVLENKKIIENLTNLAIVEIPSEICQTNLNTCVHGTCKRVVTILKNDITTIDMEYNSFVVPGFTYKNQCICKPGFGGKDCSDAVNACFSDPCPRQRVCVPAKLESGHQCICPNGHTGQNCENKYTCHNDHCNLKLSSVISFGGKSYAHYRINETVANVTLENEIRLQFNVRTVQQTGTLMYIKGIYDYSILEIVNGAVQYRFDLGSGEGFVRVSSILISDGHWHSIALERTLNSGKVIIDRSHVAQGNAPGANAVLNVPSKSILFGAEIFTIQHQEDIRRGFIGCMADIKLNTEPLPLHISGDSSTIATLIRFTNVELSCDHMKVLIPLGICGTQPCLNGGLCTSIDEMSYKCLCNSRFSGKHCELDLDPCASSPCLYGGRCEYLQSNNFTCICPSGLSGNRCEYGRFCIPNPCKNGGICEEGDERSHCLCHGYTGPICQTDINECEHQPCGNGATCINEPGSFRCVCPPYLMGSSCGDPLYSNSISSNLRIFSIEHMDDIIFGCVIFATVLLIISCYAIMRKCTNCPKSNKTSNNINYDEVNLNSFIEKDKCSKHSVKINNLEVNNHRNFSYNSPSNEKIYVANPHFVNNLDTLRNYGSAGDELECIPFEYQKINRTNQEININGRKDSETDINIRKPNWGEQVQLKTFRENQKHRNECILRSMSPNDYQEADPSMGSHRNSRYVPIDCSVLNHEQYHWDCSDWVGNSMNPLPDITEVPGLEIADSSSFRSNDSNESRSRSRSQNRYLAKNFASLTDLADASNISECCEFGSKNFFSTFQLPQRNDASILRLNYITSSENEDYKLTRANSGEIYVFPDAIQSNYSNSNNSVHLCEIEDSELEEFLLDSEK